MIFLWLLFRHFSEMHYFHMHLMLWFCSFILFRRVDPHPLISRWIRVDAHHERHQQEVLCALLPEPSPYRWRRATILQTTGPDSTYNVMLHIYLQMSKIHHWSFSTGDHTLEERRYCEEEYVPTGHHWHPEIWGIKLWISVSTSQRGE